MTFEASVQFQSQNGLIANGLIDNSIYLKAMQFDFQLIDDHPSNVDENSSGYSPLPDSRPLTQSQLQSMFGRIEFTINPDHSAITITNGWQAQNLVTIEIPQINGLPPYNTYKITVHKKVANQFRNLYDEWERGGLKSLILSYYVSFNPRLIRGSSTNLSYHAFGLLSILMSNGIGWGLSQL